MSRICRVVAFCFASIALTAALCVADWAQLNGSSAVADSVALSSDAVPCGFVPCSKPARLKGRPEFSGARESGCCVGRRHGIPSTCRTHPKVCTSLQIPESENSKEPA